MKLGLSNTGVTNVPLHSPLKGGECNVTLHYKALRNGFCNGL